MLKKLRSLFLRFTPKGAYVVYKEYLPLLKEKLLPLGFNCNEGSGMGDYAIFKYQNLEITLAYDLRDRLTYLSAKSGREFKYKATLFDQLPEEVRKEVLDIQEAEERLIYKTDIALTLEGTDAEKADTLKSLDEWLTEHL